MQPEKLYEIFEAAHRNVVWRGDASPNLPHFNTLGSANRSAWIAVSGYVQHEIIAAIRAFDPKGLMTIDLNALEEYLRRRLDIQLIVDGPRSTPHVE